MSVLLNYNKNQFVKFDFYNFTNYTRFALI